MIIIAMLNKSPALYDFVGMVIAGGQEVKGFVIMELALLWGWEGFKQQELKRKKKMLYNQVCPYMS